MTAREYLNQYREADKYARRLRREYERELELIDAVKSTADIDGLPRGKQLSKVVEDRAIRLADKAMEFKIAELEALHIRQEIFETILEVKGDAGDVLVARYVHALTWKGVESEVHWSRYKVHQLHESGLKQIEKIIQHYTT